MDRKKGIVIYQV